VSEIGEIDDNRLLQAKGRYYTLEALLAGQSEWVEYFRGGRFATIYLAPYNYHRIHMATRGELRAAWFVPGDLFSVNRTTADGVANLFARNERVVCCFKDGSLPHALLLIGALNVGSMDTVWHGEVAPRQPRRVTALSSEDSTGKAYVAERGDEMGRFNMGSTVILLFPRDTMEWNPEFVSGRTVRMGEVLGYRRGG
jgi:phosphatidylserine decarboxylase